MGSQQGLIKRTITNLWIPQNRRNFLTTKESISFQRTPFHAVSSLTCSLVLHALCQGRPHAALEESIRSPRSPEQFN